MEGRHFIIAAALVALAFALLFTLVDPFQAWVIGTINRLNIPNPVAGIGDWISSIDFSIR
jgi:hypothetical protein